MDWKSYKSSRNHKQGLKDGTHLVSVYSRNRHLHVETDLLAAQLVAVLVDALMSASGCTVKLRVPKPEGFWAGLKWRVGL
jgi:hypothetical protein